jgi:hypothetical protein
MSPRGALPKIDIGLKKIGKESRSPAEKRLEPPFAQTPYRGNPQRRKGGNTP